MDRIIFRANKDDLKKYFKDIINIDKKRFLGLLFSLSLILCGFLLMIIAIINQILITIKYGNFVSQDMILEPFLFMITGLVFMCIIIGLIIIIFPKIIFKQLWNSSNALQILITETKIVKSGKNNKKVYSWKDIKSIHNAKYNLILMQKSGIPIIIPKRAFKSNEERNEFWSLVKKYYKTR